MRSLRAMCLSSYVAWVVLSLRFACTVSDENALMSSVAFNDDGVPPLCGLCGTANKGERRRLMRSRGLISA